MLRTPALAVALAIAACAHGPSIDRQAVGQKASGDVFTTLPEAEPVQLPPLQPPTRLQSDIEKMAPADLARWILPTELAPGIVASDLLRGMTPRVNGIALYESPTPTEFPGVCSLQGYSVWLRVPNEGSLTYEQHLNPPLHPYQYTPLHRWKVVGSTIAGRQASLDCTSARSYRDWIESPSAKMVYRAVNLVEQVQRGLIRPRLDCQQWRYDEARKDTVFPKCPDARALLAQLTPNLIKRVRRADCVIAPSPPTCLGIEYHDPAAPGTHSLYVVTVPNEDRPAHIHIAQAMLPPH